LFPKQAECSERNKEKLAMKAATTRINSRLELPPGHSEKKSIRVIVQEVNQVYKPNVFAKTAA